MLTIKGNGGNDLGNAENRCFRHPSRSAVQRGEENALKLGWEAKKRRPLRQSIFVYQ